jgi:hypothetical protein
MNRADPFDRSGCFEGKFRSPGSIKYKPLPSPYVHRFLFPLCYRDGALGAQASRVAVAGVIRDSPSIIPRYGAFILFPYVLSARSVPQIRISGPGVVNGWSGYGVRRRGGGGETVLPHLVFAWRRSTVAMDLEIRGCG